MELTFIQKISIWILPLIFAITLHEVAHGWVASLRGDQTARLAGRLTLNPLKHIDLMGTIVVPLLLLLVTNFIFGWAKPVPVDARNLRHPRSDMILVSAAGPLSNFFMALGWAGIAKVGFMLVNGNDWLGAPLIYMGQAGIMINVVLGVLNFIPIPPLDGGRILTSVLPPRTSWKLAQLEPYSFFILVLLLISGILSAVISPIILVILRQITEWFGLG